MVHLNVKLYTNTQRRNSVVVFTKQDENRINNVVEGLHFLLYISLILKPDVMLITSVNSTMNNYTKFKQCTLYFRSGCTAHIRVVVELVPNAKKHFI